jgi:hypothetical protein
LKSTGNTLILSALQCKFFQEINLFLHNLNFILFKKGYFSSLPTVETNVKMFANAQLKNIFHSTTISLHSWTQFRKCECDSDDTTVRNNITRDLAKN